MIPVKVQAETEEEIMSSTEEKFNIGSFISQAEEYTGDFQDYLLLILIFRELLLLLIYLLEFLYLN